MDVVKFLIEKGAQVDLVDELGEAPLWFAVRVRIFRCFVLSFFISFLVLAAQIFDYFSLWKIGNNP